MGKLLFFDADETTFSNRTKCIPDSAKEAFHLAQENGHKIFLNTGRPLGFMDDEMRGVGFDGFLCGNGNYISYHGELLHHRMVPEDICQSIITLIEKHHIKACLENFDCSYYRDKDDNFHPHQDSMHRLYKADPSMPVAYSYDDVKQFEKFVSFGRTPEEMEAFVADVKKLPYDFTYIHNDPRFYEIIPGGADKGTAIEFIAKHLGQPLDDCYGFGDAPNDIPMFQAAGHSILMGNGYDELKDRVEFVTTDIDEDGIYNGMKHFGLI